MKLTVIIVNFNGAKFIKNCLESIIHQFQYFPSFEIIVIDNASNDNSLEVLNDYENRISLIKNSENVGFSRAHNQILDQIDSQYLWLLNNDTEFKKNQDIISPILDYLDTHPDVVGLSPKLLNTDGSLQNQGSGFSSWKYKTKKIKEVEFLSGAALFIRSEFFKQINGFDPNLFFYNDDIDFAKQVKKHHKQLIYYPDLEITHHGGLSTKHNAIDSMIAGYYGSIYLCRKYYPHLIFIIYYFLIRIFIELKQWRHSVQKTTHSREWVKQLKQLKLKLENEF